MRFAPLHHNAYMIIIIFKFLVEYPTLWSMMVRKKKRVLIGWLNSYDIFLDADSYNSLIDISFGSTDSNASVFEGLDVSITKSQ